MTQTELVMLLRVLANPPRHRDSRNLKAAWAEWAGDALGLASTIEQKGLSAVVSSVTD